MYQSWLMEEKHPQFANDVGIKEQALIYSGIINRNDHQRESWDIYIVSSEFRDKTSLSPWFPSLPDVPLVLEFLLDPGEETQRYFL